MTVRFDADDYRLVDVRIPGGVSELEVAGLN